MLAVNKKIEIENMLAMMCSTELKKLCFESFVDGIEKGEKIGEMKAKKEFQQTA